MNETIGGTNRVVDQWGDIYETDEYGRRWCWSADRGHWFPLTPPTHITAPPDLDAWGRELS